LVLTIEGNGGAAKELSPPEFTVSVQSAVATLTGSVGSDEEEPLAARVASVPIQIKMASCFRLTEKSEGSPIGAAERRCRSL
jgi:hypothetical protein